VALLAYLGNLAGKTSVMPDMRYSMAFFLVGLVLCGFCFIASYLTQLTLYNESMGWPKNKFYQKHNFLLFLAMLCFLVSIVAFAFGSYNAAIRFQ